VSIYLSDILESFYCLTSKDDTVKIEAKISSNRKAEQVGHCNSNRLILSDWELKMMFIIHSKYFPVSD